MNRNIRSTLLKYVMYITLLMLTSVHVNAKTYPGQAEVGKNYIKWTNVTLEEKKPYAISFEYKAKKMVPLTIYIDSKKFETIDFLATNNTKKWSEKITKMLRRGGHTIELKTVANRGSMPTITSMKIGDAKPVQLIIDTDMMTDCDDAAALGVAHALEDNGEAKILGVMLSAHDTNHLNSQTVSAINYYYNNNNKYSWAKESKRIPIGSWYEIIANRGRITTSMKKRFRFDHEPGINYHQAIHDEHPSDRKLDHTRGGGSTYRKYLKILLEADKAKNPSDKKTITIVVLGTNFNIVDFLEKNTDGRSPAWHQALFARTVKSISFADAANCNVNMCTHEGSSSYDSHRKKSDALFNRLLPKNIQVTFLGKNGPDIKTGKRYKGTNTPMETAYKHAYNALKDGRPSWDQIMVLVAVRGLNHLDHAYYDVKDNGYYLASFAKNQKASWKTDKYRNHRILKRNNARSRFIKGEIEKLMYQKPKKRHSFPNIGTDNYPVAKTKPAAPTKMWPYASNLTSAKLRFYDNAKNESGFRVYDAATNKILKTIPANSNTKTKYTYTKITGLKPNKTYSFYVRAYNATGSSVKSETSRTFKTLAPLKRASYTSPAKGATFCGKTTFKINRPSNVNVWFGLYDVTAKKYLPHSKSPGAVDRTSYSYTFGKELNGHVIHAYLNSYDARQNNLYIAYNHNYNYKVKCKISSVVATMTSPKNGSVISTSTVFRWNKGTSKRVRLYVRDATTNKRLYNIHTTKSSMRLKFPAGHKIDFTLQSWNHATGGKTYGEKKYRYTVKKNTSAIASMTSPGNGSRISTTTIFRWNKGSSKRVRLYVRDATTNKRLYSIHTTKSSMKLKFPAGHKIDFTLQSWNHATGGKVYGEKKYRYTVK